VVGLIKPRRKIAAAALAGTLALGGGVAYAYWTSIGVTGTGSATTGSASSALVITQTAAPTNLGPGVAPGAITGTVRNTGATNAEVGSVTVSIASVTLAVGASGSGCTAADYVLTSPAMAVNADLIPNATATAFSGATLGFNDTGADQDGCEGATVVLSYTSD
jgi:hypothetical protein